MCAAFGEVQNRTGGLSTPRFIVVRWLTKLDSPNFSSFFFFFWSEHDHNIARSLEASQATHELRIAQAVLSTTVLKPVIRAVAMENFLQRLDLSQNSLRDEGVLVSTRNSFFFFFKCYVPRAKRRS